MESVQESFAEELFSSRLFTRTSVLGVHGWSSVFESIVQAIDRVLVSEARAHGAEECFFPPVVPFDILRRAGYLEKFPHLCGSVHSFDGDDSEHKALLAAVHRNEDHTAYMKQTSLALCPAACYSVYSTLSGRLPADGAKRTLWSYVFRHEPSPDPARRQIFRMREDVRIGTPDQILSWRARWMERGVEILRQLRLDVRIVVANDPFFGRAGRFYAHNQRGHEAKFEIVAPINDTEQPTAVMSVNYHQQAFTTVFGIETEEGAPAESACMGVGLERVALALVRKHGVDPARWPSEVRNRLW